MENDRNQLYKNYLVDIILIYKQKADEALKAYKVHKTSADKDYYQGQLFSFYDVLTTLKMQANAFKIPEDEIGLNAIQPENYLS